MFRFAIREVLLVTTIVALSIGWWLDHATLRTAASKADSLERMVQRVVDMFAEETGDDFEINDGRYSFCSWREMREMSHPTDEHPHFDTTRTRSEDGRRCVDIGVERDWK